MQSNELPHDVSNFGFVDYQGQTTARLHLWPTAADACDMPGDDLATSIVKRIKERSAGEAVGYIVRMSDKCKLLTVSQNAKRLGASVLLAYADDDSHPNATIQTTAIKGRLA